MRIDWHHAILRGASWLVPREQGAEWLAEWAPNAGMSGKPRCRKPEVTATYWGACKDRLWLSRNRPRGVALMLPCRRDSEFPFHRAAGLLARRS
jgi:hypothetical protein